MAHISLVANYHHLFTISLICKNTKLTDQELNDY